MGAASSRPPRASIRQKPVVMLKAGLTAAGTRAVASHTGALAGNEQAYRAACHRAGVLVVESLQEQNDVAMALATQPLPLGNRVAILTNAGGPAALAADELDRCGLTMADLSPETMARLREVTPRGAQLGNPVDMLGGPQAEMYRTAGELLLRDESVDMLMAVFVPQAITPVIEVARNVIMAAQSAAKPVVCCLVGGESITEAVDLLNREGVPFYQDPNRAGRALASLLAYRHLRDRPVALPETIAGVDRDRVRSVLSRHLDGAGPGFLDAQQSALVASAYGIRVPQSGIATTPDEVTALADSLGYPLAMKVIAPDVIHKADVGGVRLNLADAGAVAEVFAELVGPHAERRAMLQRMAPAGQEVILGMQRDPQFGPVLMFGLGGTLVEVLRDVAFRLAPIGVADAHSMVMETAAGRILQGIRGMPPRDIEGVVDALRRLGQLAIDFPNIDGVDINPLVVGAEGSGIWAVDVRISIAPV